MNHERIESLDSLRGIAAISVLIYHFKGAYDFHIYNPVAANILELFWHGGGAISIFFVLSGFVLSRQYFTKVEGMESFSFLKYFISRIFRIYPLFIVVLFLSYLLKYFFFSRFQTNPPQLFGTSLLWMTPVSVINFIKETLLIIRIPGEPQMRTIPQDWTLTFEILISSILPFLVVLNLKNQYWFIIFIIICITKLQLSILVLDFSLGILLARNLQWLKLQWNNSPIIYKWCFFIIAIFLYGFEFLVPAGVEGFFERIHLHVSAIGSSMIVLMALLSYKIKIFLSNNILLLLGKISYGIYLLHMTVIICFIPNFYERLTQYGIQNSSCLIILGLLATLLLTFSAAFVLNKLIEFPGIALGKRLTKKINFNLYDLRL